jgi:hypothetical protein
LLISFDEQDPSDSNEMQPDTTDDGRGVAGLETFAQTRIPLDSISFQSSQSQGPQEEDEYPEWTVLFQEDGNDTGTLMEQLLARPLPQAFLMDVDILDWLRLDGLHADKSENVDGCDAYDEWDDDDWDVMPQACDVEAHQKQSVNDG